MSPRFLYRMNDKSKKRHCIPVRSTLEALAWNERGYGIFRTVNSFTSPERTKVNLSSFKYAYCEIDVPLGVRKSSVLGNLSSSPLPPTKIVETRNGFHAYWRLLGGYGPDKYGDYRKCLKGLACHFDGDTAAMDGTRVLREPGFYHHKGEPYEVKLVSQLHEGVMYSLAQLMHVYPPPRPKIIKHLDSMSGLLIMDVLVQHKISITYANTIHCPAPKRHKGGVDHNPSCQIFPDTNSFYCWSCRLAGTAEQLEKRLGKLQRTTA